MKIYENNLYDTDNLNKEYKRAKKEATSREEKNKSKMILMI